MSAWLQFASTALGAGVGGGAVIYGQHLAGKRAADAETRAWERRRRDQRDSAHRATILELQEALLDLRNRAIDRMVANRRRRSAEVMGRRPEPKGHIDAEWARSIDRARVVASRVIDEPLRLAAQNVIDSCIIVAHAELVEAVTENGNAQPLLRIVDDRVTELLAQL